MDRLAIFGWSPSTPALVHALAEGARLEPAAVGDERSAALARARRALEIPCFHHVAAMARLADYDVALIGAGDVSAEIAASAAHRGADLLLDGAFADGDSLVRAAAAAIRHGVALVVFRPWLRAAGLPWVTARLAEAPPDLLVIDAVEERLAISLLRDLVALTARIAGVDMLDLAASPAGAAEDPGAIALQLRFAGGRVASITARRGEVESLQLLASGPAGTTRLRREGGTTTVECSGADSREFVSETLSSKQATSLLIEAQRVPEARAAGEGDALFAAAEGVILAAAERALEFGFAQHLEAHTAPALRLLRGGGHAPAAKSGVPRRTTLSLVPR